MMVAMLPYPFTKNLKYKHFIKNFNKKQKTIFTIVILYV
ncbi:hypothetical protein bmyco0001_10310 [Bacillus mycoides DSM 2048]|nr:hypothetical protein bmyco0001_10310 [Bacillus mycoides DSM 2048]